MVSGRPETGVTGKKALPVKRIARTLRTAGNFLVNYQAARKKFSHPVVVAGNTEAGFPKRKAFPASMDRCCSTAICRHVDRSGSHAMRIPPQSEQASGAWGNDQSNGRKRRSEMSLGKLEWHSGTMQAFALRAKPTVRVSGDKQPYIFRDRLSVRSLLKKKGPAA